MSPKSRSGFQDEENDQGLPDERGYFAEHAPTPRKTKATATGCESAFVRAATGRWPITNCWS